MLQEDSATEIVAAIRAGKKNPVDFVEKCLKKIKEQNAELNAVITINENAKADAERVAKEHPNGQLLGVPVLLKDNLCLAGMRTTAASKMLENFTAPYTATLVRKLVDEGAIILGKTNMDEFAMGSSNETSYFGPCKNPWNTEYVPGGSSGGSAAATAARMCSLAIGTDTGGSIRQPASFCGVYGLKPTYGRVSRYGVIAFASSLDQAGPFATCTSDLALSFKVMSGFDPLDSTSSREVVKPWVPDLKRKLKIGIIKEFQGEFDAEVSSHFTKQIELLKKLNCEFQEISLPMVEMAIPVYYLIATSEASSNLSRYDGVRFGYRSNFEDRPAKSLQDFYQRNRSEGFGEEVKRRLMLGAFSLSSGYYDAYYKKASQIRRILRNQLVEAFNEVDVIMTPTSATLPFKIGEKLDDPIKMFQNDRLTTFASLAGMPSVSVPTGVSANSLPIGMQFTAVDFNENALFDVSYLIEKQGGG